MFTRILNKIAGDYNTKQIQKIKPILSQIDHYYQEFSTTLTANQIPQQTRKFQQMLASGETLDTLLPQAFALVKYACHTLVGTQIVVRGQTQTRNMVPYDVQLIGGIILHQGKIAEMKTGEGKTLVATLPLYLNALTGRGAHLVTVNDYLAQRDSEQMWYLYRALGMSVGCVHKGISPHNRKVQYQCDITYVENSELGFDYLRDNLVRSKKERSLTWRPLYFAIVDEADSILIDEARTPLIISQPSDEATEKYSRYAAIIQQLTPCSGPKRKPKSFLKELLEEAKDAPDPHLEDGDFYIDEKHKTATLSGQGITKLEHILWISNLYKDLGYDEIHHIENALKAKNCYIADKDYIIRNGEVLIVDEHTGRTMPGRRYSEWLHQAIEAKEWLKIQKESQTLATVTYQNFFKLYDKIAGMTGTATTEWEEFEKIYWLEVLSVPTNQTCIRIDQHDKVYFDQKAKWNTVCQTIKLYHEIGVPQLIGTSSIYTSEYVSGLLRQMGIQHHVLNAKYHEQEAQIVSNAGKYGSVVVATNMAGRGTDIKLEPWLNDRLADNYIKRITKTTQGDTFTDTKPQHIKLHVYSEYEYQLLTIRLQASNIAYQHTLNKSYKAWLHHYATIIIMSDQAWAETKEYNAYFGLMIIGTEKHESRRIDNQLRGRAGRQGDPGSSQFFVALDDEIMRKMWGEKIQSIAGMLLSKQDLQSLELTQKQFTSSIERAQKQMEAYHFGIRKHLFDYDNVINKQRHKVYGIRDAILGVATHSQTDTQDTTSDNHDDLSTHGITKVLILHWFGGHADSGWKWRLKNELEQHWIQVRSPQLTDADQPVLSSQIQQVWDLCGDQLDEHTAIVGHSLGWLLAQHLVTQLSTQSKKIGLLLGVAPAYHTLKSSASSQSNPDLQTWVTALEAYKLIPVHPEDVVKWTHQYRVYLSQNDTLIPFDETYQYFASQYPGVQIQVFENMWHFSHSEGINLLPQALEDILWYEWENTQIISDIRWFISDLIGNRMQHYVTTGLSAGEFVESIQQDLGIDLDLEDLAQTDKLSKISQSLVDMIQDRFDLQIAGQDPVRLSVFFKNIYLATIDKHRIQHIDEMHYLREKVWLYGYAQMDPLIMYKQEAYEKFQTLMQTIQAETLSIVFKTDFSNTPQSSSAVHNHIDPNKLNMSGWDSVINPQQLGEVVKFAQQIQQDMQRWVVWPGSVSSMSQDGLEVIDLTKQVQTDPRAVIVPENRKTRPNDPCPCGSGKKYKKCHGT